MTPDTLESAVLAGDTERCLAALAGLTEPERDRVATRMVEIRKRIEPRNSRDPAEIPPPAGVEFEALRRAASIAVLGTASMPDIRRLGVLISDFTADAYAVMADRRPTWIEEWANWLLAATPWPWPTVRRLIREGVCPRPQTETYILAMISYPRRDRSLLAELQEDRDLLAHEVWRLFEIEGEGNRSLAARDKHPDPDFRWLDTLAALADQGLLSRDRLLDASLGALERDFAQVRAGWFSRFHRKLAPTVDEMAARAERYLGLLSNRIPPTVTLALDAVVELEQVNRLTDAGLLASLPPTLYSRDKKTVSRAVRLLERVAERSAELRPQVAELAVPALEHPGAEVQSAALDLIERCGHPLPQGLGERLSTIVAALQPRLERLLPFLAEEVPLQSIAKPPAPTSAATAVPAWRQRADQLDPTVAALAGLPAAVAAAEKGSFAVGALDLRDPRIPRLLPEARLSPIGSLDELIERCSAALENHGPPEELELVLEGVARFCDARPAQWEELTAPLRKRSLSLMEKAPGKAFRGDPRANLAAVVVSWLGADRPHGTAMAKAVARFTAARCEELAQRAAARQAGPLLAAPTHKDGWLDPRVLVVRIRELQSAGLVPGRLDLIQALLRLATDGRSGALTAAVPLTGEAAEALRYALGGEVAEIGPDAALWVAAARARAPLADDEHVEAVHPGLGPDAGQAARLVFHTHDANGKPLPRPKLDRSPAPPTQLPTDLPTVLLHTPTQWRDLPTLRWQALVWPQHREAWFGMGVQVFLNNLDWSEAEWGNRAFLEPLLHPDTHPGPMGVLLLALGLAAKEPGESGLATDVYATLVQDGRLDGTNLGESLAILLDTGVIKPGRWAKTLGEASRASPLVAETTRLALETTLGRTAQRKPADLAPLLELFEELVERASASVTSEATREALGTLKSGKAGQVARRLLELSRPGDETYRSATLRDLVGARLQRAERWQSGFAC